MMVPIRSMTLKQTELKVYRGGEIMKKVKIMLDFLAGPIWKDVYDIQKQVLITSVDIIDNNAEIQ